MNVKKIWLICEQKMLQERLNENKQFYEGALDEENMKQKYLMRSFWHNELIFNECKATGDDYIYITSKMSFEELLQKSLVLINS